MAFMRFIPTTAPLGEPLDLNDRCVLEEPPEGDDGHDEQHRHDVTLTFDRDFEYETWFDAIERRCEYESNEQTLNQ